MATATIKVGGNGNYTAWTRSDTGVSAYTLVDEGSSHDSDTTYIYTSSNNNRSSFTLLSSDLAGLPAMISITNMTIYGYDRRSAGTAVGIKFFFRLSGTDSDSTEASLGSTYTQQNRSPSRPGGGSWSKDDLASLEIGVMKASGTGTPNTVRCTSIYLVITYDELSGGTTYSMGAGSGSFTLTGKSITANVKRTVTLGAGSFTLSGKSISARAIRQVTLGTGSFVLTGSPITPKAHYPVTLGAGSYVLSGKDITARAIRRVSVGAGVFMLTGNAIDVILPSMLTLGGGSFALTGNQAEFNVHRSVTLGAATLILVGHDIEVILHRKKRGGHHGQRLDDVLREQHEREIDLDDEEVIELVCVVLEIMETEQWVHSLAA